MTADSDETNDAGEHALPPAITDSELKALLEQARRTGDERLHRLVTAYVTLRRVTADVIILIEAREGGAAVAGMPLLRRARALADAPRR